MSARRPLPRWADIALLPVLNLVLAMIVSSIVIALIGQNPFEAIKVMAYGAFGYGEGIGFTLHFATDFIFTGRTSHAAASPHLGRSALDAVELMNVGVNYMREHMPSDARVHYALLDTGGIAPNVVQAHARVRYSIRARDLPGMNELVHRVNKIAQGAALMTETKMEMRVISAVVAAV